MLVNKFKSTIKGLSAIALRVMSSKKVQVKSKKNNYYFDLNDLAKTVQVTYNIGTNLEKPKTVNAVYVEVCSSPNPRATVVGLPGSPGSHNDFKYMKIYFEQNNIRLLCLNWPGSEFVEGGLYDSFSNPERNSYAKAVLKTLNVEKCNRIILLGHSRGGENALELAAILAKDNWPIIGATLINSPGFRPHRGISSRQGTLWLLTRLIKWRFNFINSILFKFLEYYYNKIVHLRVPNGATAAAAMITLTTFAFEKQKKIIEYLTLNPKIRAFYGFGSDDFLIETENSEEIANAFTGHQHFTISKETNENDIIDAVTKHYVNGGQFVTAKFVPEGHYLQKTYPEFLLKVIDAIVTSDEVNSNILQNSKF